MTNLLNDTINKSNEVYMANHAMPEKHVNGIDCLAGTAVYTAFTMKTIWTSDVGFSKHWQYSYRFKKRGMAQGKRHLGQGFWASEERAEDYTQEALKSSERTKTIGEFIESPENKKPEEM